MADRPSIDTYTWVAKSKLLTPEPTASLVQVFRGFWWVGNRATVGFLSGSAGTTALVSRDRAELLDQCPDGCEPTYLALAHVTIELAEGADYDLALPR